MGNLQKALLLLALPLLLILIGWNAYHSRRNLEQVNAATAQRASVSSLQADISRIQLDVDDIERGQHGYILTEDVSYLDPYQKAIARLGGDFATLRSELVHRSPGERNLETKMEELVRAKQAEAEQAIHWRQQGYRHRAFLLVESGEGKKLTDAARENLAALASAVAANFTAYDRETKAALDTAARSSMLANLALFVVTLLVYAVLILYISRLGREVNQATLALRDVKSRLHRFSSAISQDVRASLDSMQDYSHRLLEQYGDFLPLQGQNYAQRLKETAEEMSAKIDEIARTADANPPEPAVARSHGEAA